LEIKGGTLKVEGDITVGSGQSKNGLPSGSSLVSAQDSILTVLGTAEGGRTGQICFTSEPPSIKIP